MAILVYILLFLHENYLLQLLLILNDSVFKNWFDFEMMNFFFKSDG